MHKSVLFPHHVHVYAYAYALVHIHPNVQVYHVYATVQICSIFKICIGVHPVSFVFNSTHMDMIYIYIYISVGSLLDEGTR